MINVNDPKLLASGHKYRKELLAMPILQLETLTRHMTLRVGVRGKESVGQVGSGAELSPYKTNKTESDFKDTASLGLRDLETFLGEVLERYDPVVLSSTAYGNQLAKPIEEFDLVKSTAFEMAKSVGGKLRNSLFKASRNSAGKRTLDLFDGFSTIAEAEIVSGGLSEEKKNLKNLSKITSVNAFDELLALFLGASDELQSEANVKMFLPTDLYNAYNAACVAELGAIAYNTQYEKKVLHGSDGRCELVSCSSMAGTNQVIVTTQNNMLVGCDQLSDKENVEIRRDNMPTLVQFYLNAYFGVQFESISPERLIVGKIATE